MEFLLLLPAGSRYDREVVMVNVAQATWEAGRLIWNEQGT